MSTAEREIAIDDDSEYARSVSDLYPLLIERGEELEAAGVDYFDMTMLFEDEDEQRYIDTCCHLNAAGSEELARAMGRAIVERLEER